MVHDDDDDKDNLYDDPMHDDAAAVEEKCERARWTERKRIRE